MNQKAPSSSPEPSVAATDRDANLTGVLIPELPGLDAIERLIPTLVGQIRWARQYTLELLAATPLERWYETPPGHRSHIAWQVGHLAVSQYGLLMFRIRGRRPEDLDLIPGRFRKTFGRGGTPPPSADDQPTPEELFDKLNAVHRQAIAEIQETPLAVWREPVEMPHSVYACKLGAALFCPLHESLHAGQVGGLRRGLGLESVR